ncbi:TonB-dependent receptor [bacterium]|nr:TonB-dependent receptor [bacterium]
MTHSPLNPTKSPVPKLGIRIFYWIILILSILFVLAELSFGQSDESHLGAIRGRVVEQGSLDPVAAANVLVPGTTRGAATDLKGAFQIDHLEPGTYSLRISSLGYEEKTIYDIPVSPGRSRFLEIRLHATAVVGEEVTVTVDRYVPSTPELPTSARNLRYEEVRRAPGGLEDVQRTVQALPGVVTSNDQDNAVIVRGGAPDENLTIIDGIEVENTNHLTIGDEVKGNGGPINALSTEFLQDVTFASGGFSARYGDRLSSVLVLDLREGSRERYAGAADINMAGAGGYAEGPLPGGKGSFLVTAHRAYLNLLPPEDFGVQSWPDYWNGQAKVTWDFSPRHHLAINTLLLEDEVDDREQPSDDEDGKWDGLILHTRRMMTGARLRSVWGNGFSDLVVGRSTAMSEWEFIANETDNAGTVHSRTTTKSRRATTQDQVHLHWNGNLLQHDQWAAGLSLKPFRYEYTFYTEGDSILYNDDVLGGDADNDPDVFQYDDQREKVDETGLKIASYLQFTWRPTRDITLTGGGRLDAFDYAEQVTLAPRFSASWSFRPRWAVSMAYGHYYQSHDPSVYMNKAGQAYNKTLPHARADQIVAGFSYQPRSSSLLTIEAFHKDYTNLLVREEDVVREQTDNRMYQSDRWLKEATKEAWGLELFAQQKLADRWYGTLSYSYGKAEADDPAYGEYPSDFDYRHVATATLGYKTSLITNKGYRSFVTRPWGWWLYVVPINGDEVTFSSRYRLMSGRPHTTQIWYAEGEESPEPIYEGHWEEGAHNSERYPTYSRWDIRADSKHYFGRSALIYYLEIQNIDDHLNVADYIYKENGVRETALQFRQFWVLGIRYEF